MIDSSKKYYSNAFIWGGISKVVQALVQFISLPLLLVYFGKGDYGLIVLAVSINAYLQLLDMGINTGAVKYFSEWIEMKNYKLLDSVVRTSISFYFLIGLINSCVLLIISYLGISSFSIALSQVYTLRILFHILALFSVINWVTSVFNQLLIANEGVSYINKINIVKNLFLLLLTLIIINFKLSLINYFFFYIFINSLIFIPFYIKAKKEQLISSFIPQTNWKDFSIIFKYSLAIISMGIFQITSTQSRPLILSIFSNKIEILSDYRIMETITLFVISIGGMFVSIFLPKTSKLLLSADKNKILSFVYRATSYTTIICVILCIPIILCSKEIISLYVGDQYLYLQSWLIIWVITILFYLHNSPIASLVLSTGKTRMLIYSSAIACVVSLIVNIVFCRQIGVGSAVLGYVVYIFIQMSFYYFYFNKVVLNLDSYRVFKSFIIPVLLGLVVAFFINSINFGSINLIILVFIKSLSWMIIYLCFLFFIKILKKDDIKFILKK